MPPTPSRKTNKSPQPSSTNALIIRLQKIGLPNNRGSMSSRNHHTCNTEVPPRSPPTPGSSGSTPPPPPENTCTQTAPPDSPSRSSRAPPISSPVSPETSTNGIIAFHGHPNPTSSTCCCKYEIGYSTATPHSNAFAAARLRRYHLPTVPVTATGFKYFSHSGKSPNPFPK